MAENSVKVRFQVEGNAAKEFKKLADSTVDFQKKSTKAFSAARQTFNTFAGVLSAQVAFGALKSLAKAASDFFKLLVTDGIAAAQRQEDAINQLNVALAASGMFSREASEELQEFASSLQAVTKFGDEAILETQALIQSLGQLDKEGLKTATKATLDLSAALGIDLKAAALLVGKAASGEISSFSRYGLVLQKGATNADTFANALDAINKRFGGAAAAQVNTFSGATQQLSNTWGDFTEQIGFAITKNEAVISVIKQLNTVFGNFEDGTRNNSKEVKILIAEGLIGLIDASAAVVIAFDAIGRAGSIVFNSVRGAILILGESFAGVLSLFDDSWKQTVADFDARSKEAFQSVSDAVNGEGGLQPVVDRLLDMRDAAEEGFAKVREGAESTIDPLNAQAEAIQGLTQDQRNQITELLELNKLLREEDEITNAARISENKKTIDKLTKDKKFAAKEDIKIQLAVRKQDEAIQQERLSATKSSLNELGQLQSSKSKELAAIGKASAIAATVISTYEGAGKAAAALAGIPVIGPALAAAAATAFIAGGLARVAKIAGTPLQTGIDEVPAGFPNDTFRANLTSGERVVPAETNQDLKAFLAGGGNRDVLESIAARLDNLQSQTIVNVGGEEIVNEVRNQIEGGRVLAPV